jgi:hypothetical protein
VRKTTIHCRKPTQPPNGRGVADDQGEDIPVRQDRAKIEQRLGIVLASGIPARQRFCYRRHPRRRRHLGCLGGAAPAQQRSDASEQERERCGDGEGAGVPGRDARAGCPFDPMRERSQAGHVHAGHGDAGQSAECERREQAVAQRHAQAGHRAQGARGEIELPGGPPVGQADQRNDGEI